MKEFGICMKVLLTTEFLIVLMIDYIYSNTFDDALKLYKDGSYRRSISVLSMKGALSPVECYLLGRDFQEMRDNKNAADAFSKINPDSFNNYPESGFFRENYIYYYSLILYGDYCREDENILTNSPGKIIDLFSRLDQGSVYYDDVLKIYLLYEWKTLNYALLDRLKQTNSTALMYRAFSSYALGRHEFFSEIFNFNDERDFNLIFAGITNLIRQDDIDRILPDRIPQALNVFYRFNMTDFASRLLKRYASITNDADLILRSRLYLLCREGNFDEALKLFNVSFNHGGCSACCIESFSGILQEYSHNGEAYSLLKKAVEIYTAELTQDWIRILDKMHKYEELYSWAYPLISKGEIDQTNSRKIFRLILGDNRGNAEKIAREMLKFNDDDPYFLYVNALYDLNAGNNSDAYINFLKVKLYHPFTFEGIVSGTYESSLRSSFSNIFSSETVEFRKKNINMNPADRLNSLTALGEIDSSPEESKLSKDFQDGIARGFADDSLTGILPMKLFLFFNRGLLSYNHEIFNIVDRRITDPVSRLKASYNYGDFYRSIGMEGAALSRLNLYITKICGGREYHPILDERMRKILYPLLYFSNILAFSRDTNDSLWTLSVFREESHFNKNSVSPAGAAGMAQLMPATAEIIKRNMKKEEYNCFDFRDNLEIGAFHINYLFRKYHHNYLYALAAYNAGEPAVNRWKKRFPYGNELWIESIDYDETREYIRRVIQTRYFYSLFYGYVGLPLPLH